MALEYVVTKRVFGFDQSKTEKYVARSVGSGQVRFRQNDVQRSVDFAESIEKW